MRASLLLIPAGLLGGYLALGAARGAADDATRLPKGDAPAEQEAFTWDDLVRALDGGGSDDVVRVRGTASATVRLDLDASLRGLAHEIADELEGDWDRHRTIDLDDLDLEDLLEDLDVTGELLAELVTALEGTVEIRTPDGRVLVADLGREARRRRR